jgi:hypothetical protein
MNEIIILPTIKIPLTQGKFAIINECDAEMVLAFSWRAVCMKGSYWYGATSIRTNGPRRQAVLFLHRLIIPNQPFVDHRNHDGLDNRRVNLRPATQRQNQANQAKRKGSQFKGIYKRRTRWIPNIRWNGKKLKMGSFKSPENAARIYDQAARLQWGEYALTNFP